MTGEWCLDIIFFSLEFISDDSVSSEYCYCSGTFM